MRVSLSNLPSFPKEYIIDFPRLDGGLNTEELDYRLNANESPEMRNLWWKDGVLCCRDGQVLLTDGTNLGTTYAAYSGTYWGCAFAHVGDTLYYIDLSGVADSDAGGELAMTALLAGVPENGGTWFRYGDSLLYKNRGGYYIITYAAPGFTAAPVAAYSPIILINADPTTAAGDEYQPENRMSGQKTVWYSTAAGVTEYHLPVQNVDSIDRVEVDGAATTAYTADLAAGTVTFTEEPTHHEPVQVNTVRITYTKANPDAYNSVMGCPYACVYGGDQNICVVLGGSEAQPNAYFWSGNDAAAMNPGYFPMEQYNLAGDTEEAVTGFGKQQALLVIFKENSVGRALMGTTQMANGRTLITMDYTNINSRIGCDLPGSILLVQNNLVFCNTKQGVHMVLDSSSAHENNIVRLSHKVERDLLTATRSANRVTAADDGDRYWLIIDGEAYLWDYAISGYSDPSWFFLSGLAGAAYFRENDSMFHFDGTGGVSVFRRVFSDYGAAIDKVYRFAPQHMGGYDYLKDVVGVIFVVRSDTDTLVNIEYETDYERRMDLTPLRSFSWKLAPRNLAYRYLGVQRYASVSRRKPGCRHVRHFGMRLTNNEVGMDLSVVSAQIFYRFTGRDR